MDFDIVIVGAGLVGASFAMALRGAGLKLALVEAQTPVAAGDTWDSRVYAISPGSAAFLDGLGVWKRLDRVRICAVHEMLVHGDGADALLHFSAYESGVPELAWIVENRQLQSMLWQGVEHQSYGQMGVVANFSCARAHHNTAYQWFRDDGVLAYLPLPEQRMSIVWSTHDAHAAELLALPADALCVRVAEAGKDALGKLDLLSAPMQFPLARLRAARLAVPRIALIGDAGHVLHPLAGQGVNLGFGDAGALARVLLQRELFRDPGEIRLLRRYERTRAEDILALAWVTDGLQQLFAAPGGVAAKLRNAGLNLTNGLPVVKNLLIRRALG